MKKFNKFYLGLFVGLIIIIAVILFFVNKANNNKVNVDVKVTELNLKDNIVKVSLLKEDKKIGSRLIYVDLSSYVDYKGYDGKNDIEIEDQISVIGSLTLVKDKGVTIKAKSVKKGVNKPKVDMLVSDDEDGLVVLDDSRLSENGKKVIEDKTPLLNYKPDEDKIEKVDIIKNGLEYTPYLITITSKVDDNTFKFRFKESTKDTDYVLSINNINLLEDEDISVLSDYIMFLDSSTKIDTTNYVPRLIKEVAINDNISYRLETWDDNFTNKEKTYKLDIKKSTLINGGGVEDVKGKLALVVYRKSNVIDKDGIKQIEPAQIYILQN